MNTIEEFGKLMKEDVVLRVICAVTLLLMVGTVALTYTLGREELSVQLIWGFAGLVAFVVLTGGLPLYVLLLFFEED